MNFGPIFIHKCFSNLYLHAFLFSPINYSKFTKILPITLYDKLFGVFLCEVSSPCPSSSPWQPDHHIHTSSGVSSSACRRRGVLRSRTRRQGSSSEAETNGGPTVLASWELTRQGVPPAASCFLPLSLHWHDLVFTEGCNSLSCSWCL